jgi:hypothetical protein
MPKSNMRGEGGPLDHRSRDGAILVPDAGESPPQDQSAACAIGRFLTFVLFVCFVVNMGMKNREGHEGTPE